MKLLKLLGKLLQWLLKLAFKLLMLLIWGALSIVEVIIHHISDYFKKLSAH